VEQRRAARSRAAGNWPKSGKKRWEFRLSLDAMPAFVRVCEDSVAEGRSAYWSFAGLVAAAVGEILLRSLERTAL
jgi:hypothetical protein